MPCGTALAALAVLVTLAAQATAGSSSCPDAAGDGTKDDSGALQECLDASEAIQLKEGATYLLSQRLRVDKKRQIAGGADSNGVLTTFRCGSFATHDTLGFHVSLIGELEVHSILVENCGTGFRTYGGKMTLVDSTISNSDFALKVSGLMTTAAGVVFMRGCRILDSSYSGIEMSGHSRVVMEGSEIARSERGVSLQDTKQAVLELHSSVIRESMAQAIVTMPWMKRPPMSTWLLLAGKSSLRSSVDSCIALTGGSHHRVHIVNRSFLHACRSGVLLQNIRDSEVVLKDHAMINDTHDAIVLDGGERHRVVLESSSRIQRSDENGIQIRRGEGHTLEVTGFSSIVDNRGSHIWVEGGHGHSVNITGGSWLRSSRRTGVLLAAKDSVLRLEDVSIRESGVSAIRIRPAAPWTPRECTNVSLQAVYIVRNRRGFYCKRTCVNGEINGTLYLNDRDYANYCLGELSIHGPLVRMTGYQVLKSTTRWCTLTLGFCGATLPWLQVLRTWFRVNSSPRRCSIRLVMSVVIVFMFVVFRVWAWGMVGFWQAMQELEYVDLQRKNLTAYFGIALAFPFVVPYASLTATRWWRRRWHKAEVVKLSHSLEESLWHGHSQDVELIRNRLSEHGLAEGEIQAKVTELLGQQSHEAGVSVAYLISPDFLDLACSRTGLENPTFLQMKEPFWTGEDPIGKDVLCPRDGRPGCALVDTLPPRHRQRCTHFLSWVWRYPVRLVREALQIWTEEEGLDPSETFLFMCFFVNNQFRILIEGTASGSDDLETTFERNLMRIGRVVALLDHWQQPLYLSRIWTIYEQYVAAKLQLPVTVILNQSAGHSLIDELDKGKDGIFHITSTLCSVRAETAEASVKADEEHVKARIRSTIGFDSVNQRVRHSMINWVAGAIRRHMDNLVNAAEERGTTTKRKRAALVRSVFCCMHLERAARPLTFEIEEPPS